MWINLHEQFAYETAFDCIIDTHPYFSDLGRYTLTADNGNSVIMEWNPSEETWQDSDGYLYEDLGDMLRGMDFVFTDAKEVTLADSKGNTYKFVYSDEK